jgi:hypothetical protein
MWNSSSLLDFLILDLWVLPESPSCVGKCAVQGVRPLGPYRDLVVSNRLAAPGATCAKCAPDSAARANLKPKERLNHGKRGTEKNRRLPSSIPVRATKSS